MSLNLLVYKYTRDGIKQLDLGRYISFMRKDHYNDKTKVVHLHIRMDHWRTPVVVKRGASIEINGL